MPGHKFLRPLATIEMALATQPFLNETVFECEKIHDDPQKIFKIPISMLQFVP
jgi:hypothetical protein